MTISKKGGNSMLKKLTALLVVSCLSVLSQARYSKINFNDVVADYESSFKTKEFNMKLEDDYEVESDLLKIPTLQDKQSVATAHPVVGQEDSYDGYVKPKEAFSQTDGYQYALQFKIGAKLDNNYDYVDECFDAWILLFDDIAYYKNNVTYTELMLANDTLSTWWFTYLNLTGIIFAPISDIIVDCYRFGESVYEYESERLVQFGSDWGEFFLSFLFNQMGNALQFQAKFSRIQEYNTKQNYQSIWLEYGDLFYLIWTFDPISSSSYDSIADYLNEFIETYELMDPEQPYHQMVASTGIPVVAQTIKDFANDFDTHMKSFGQGIENFFDDLRVQREKIESQLAFIDDTKLVNTFGAPWSLAVFTAPDDVYDLLYGIVNGAIDVFPYSSNPNRCRNNITQAWGAGVNWANWQYDFTGSKDDRLTVFKEFTYFI